MQEPCKNGLGQTPFLACTCIYDRDTPCPASPHTHHQPLRTNAQRELPQPLIPQHLYARVLETVTLGGAGAGEAAANGDVLSTAKLAEVWRGGSGVGDGGAVDDQVTEGVQYCNR